MLLSPTFTQRLYQMLPFNAHKDNQGFTLIETLAVVVIVGILSAISAPSFLSLFSREKVSAASDQLRGALQEAQREAIRRSKTCTVYIPDATQAQLISKCFVTSDGTSTGLSGAGIADGIAVKKLDNVAIASNLTSNPKIITFSFKGNTSIDVPTNVVPKIVLYSSDGSTQKKTCLAISNGIGIIRTGNYAGSTTPGTDITAGTCTTK